MDSKGEVWKTFIVLVPTLSAALIAVSRIMDARHHPFDVITGSLLGILVAWAAYRQYFPPVTEPWHKGRAYPIRSWGTDPKVPPQQYQDTPRDHIRDHSPVELLRMAGQPGVSDPEYGSARTKPVDVSQNPHRGDQGAYQNRAEYPSAYLHNHSPSSTDLEHTPPVVRGGTF